MDYYKANPNHEPTLWRLSDYHVYRVFSCEYAMLASFAACIEIHLEDQDCLDSIRVAISAWTDAPSTANRVTLPWEVRPEDWRLILRDLEGNQTAHPVSTHMLSQKSMHQHQIEREIANEIRKENHGL